MNEDVLFVTICTKRKNAGGTSGYEPEKSIVSMLSEDHRTKLLKTREEIRSQLDNIIFDGIVVHEENQSLKYSEDFGGPHSGEANYLPAYERYNGRFYNNETGLRVKGTDGLSGFDRLFRNNYHLLILSGLYGIVEAHENIQNYSCPIDNSSINLLDIWTSDNIITESIIDYINYQEKSRKKKISRVFDLTGMKIYRDLVNWEKIYLITGAMILHVYNKKLAGDGAIEIFGRFFRDYLLSLPPDRLLAIKIKDNIQFEENELFTFSKKTNPPKGWAEESVRYERVNSELHNISLSYKEADKKLRDAIRFNQYRDYDKMKKAVDSGFQQLGKTFEIALKKYLYIDKSNTDGLGRYTKKFINTHPVTPLDKNRLEFYTSIRNQVSHDYHTQLMDYYGFIQYVRYFLIEYLEINSNTLPNPINYLCIPTDYDDERD